MGPEYELAEARVRNHSRLFALAPIGKGTFWVEGLAGYVVRLAEAHIVLPQALMKSEIMPLLHTTYSAREKPSAQYRLTGTWWWQISAILNGLNSSTQEWVEALQRLTLREDLQFLTMLSWADVLSCRGLMRREKAWCPDCYREWWAEERPLYSPLVWSLEVVKICPRHHRYLQTRCPYDDCRQKVPVVGPSSILGFCVHCHRWLGNAAPDDHPMPGQAELDDQLWIAEAVGELLEAAPTLSGPPRPSTFSLAIAAYIDEVLSGNARALACLSGLHHTSVYALRDGRQMPQLGTLLKLSFILGISPLALLTGEYDRMAFHAPHDAVDLSVSIVRPQQRSPSFDRQHMKQALRQVIEAQGDPPPSMRVVAVRLGCDQSFLRKSFPEECVAISKQHQEYAQHRKTINRERNCERVRQAVFTLHKQGVFPSHKRLRRMIGGALRDPFARQARRELLQELGYQEVLTETSSLCRKTRSTE